MKKNDKGSLLRLFLKLGPLLYILAIIGLDCLIPSPIFTPVLATIGLIYMALSYSLRLMVFWSLVYSAIIAIAFFVPQVGWWMNNHVIVSPFTAWIRTCGFIITSVLACMYCNSMNVLRAMNQEQEGVLNLMSEPIVTSDIDGRIRFMNNAAKALLSKSGESGESGESGRRNYFENFFPKKTMGSSIANYLKQFDDHHDHGVLDVEIASKQYLANTQMMTSGTGKILVTIVNVKGVNKSDA